MLTVCMVIKISLRMVWRDLTGDAWFQIELDGYFRVNLVMVTVILEVL